MRRILVITASALLFLAACTAPVKGWPEPLNTLTVSLLYPDGAGNGAGGEIVKGLLSGSGPGGKSRCDPPERDLPDFVP